MLFDRQTDLRRGIRSAVEGFETLLGGFSTDSCKITGAIPCPLCCSPHQVYVGLLGESGASDNASTDLLLESSTIVNVSLPAC